MDELGNQSKFTLASGERYDIKQAAALIDGLESEYVIVDRGYGADEFLAKRRRAGFYTGDTAPAELVKCFISKVKQYRRVFTRYDKLTRRYLGFIQGCELTHMAAMV